MKEMILFMARSQFHKRNTFFNVHAQTRPPTPGEKDLQKEKREGENTERPRSKEEKTKRTGAGERDRGKKGGRGRKRGSNPCCSAIFGALKLAE